MLRMLKRVREDKVILYTTLTLLVLGLVMVYSSSSVLALKRYGDPAYFLKRQVLWAAAGIVAMMLAWKTDYKKVIRPLSLPALVVVFILHCAALAGPQVNGARRWIRLGGFSLQPSEFVKPALLVFVSASVAKRTDKLKEFWTGLGPYIVIVGMFALLILLEPDLGTAALILAVVGATIFVGGARPLHLMALVLAALPVLYLKLHSGFRLDRLMAYVDPWSDPHGKGFQIIQSFLAFGGGGLTGLGLGESRQKLLFLPEPHNDFIFSVIGEEFGLVGGIIVPALFLAFTLFGLRLALKCRDGFGKLLVFSLTLALGMQALMNMGVATGLFPNKGLPLPFVSYGGSSVFVALVSVGIILSVARTERKFMEDEGHTDTLAMTGR